MNHSDTLESLVVSANRLIRIAAQATGTSRPSAIWRTLGILENDGPMRVGELATASRVTQPGMTRILATMVEEELVSRIADVEDSRAWLIRITQKGRQQLNAYRKQIGDTLEPLFRDLDDTEWQTLVRATALIAARTTTTAAASA